MCGWLPQIKSCIFALDIWFDVVKILINDAADALLKPQTESLKV